ncbi:transposase [Streptomyces sp. NPDC006290]|uniref:transposase n=1 Tax=Streptomyces sp. NPDC006290 TaxID=3156745 RepID=UPI0033B0C5D8
MEEGGLAAGKSIAAACDGWIGFEDEAGQSLTPPRARSWGRRGCTPVVRVRGRGSGRIDGRHDLLQARRTIPALLLRPRVHRTQGPAQGLRLARLPRPVDPRPHPARRPDRPGLGQRPPAPDQTLREFIEANSDWLTVFQLPTYAPDLNPQEGIWSLVKRDIGNLAATDLGQITRAVKRKLKMLQYRPEIIDGCLVGTGLVLDA